MEITAIYRCRHCTGISRDTKLSPGSKQIQSMRIRDSDIKVDMENGSSFTFPLLQECRCEFNNEPDILQLYGIKELVSVSSSQK